MTLLDKAIRYWRARVALRHTLPGARSVFDIGCDDGFLLRQLDASVIRREGMDPRLEADICTNEMTLRKGHFPLDLGENQMKGEYDVIFALAVLEHFSEEDIKSSATAIRRMLAPDGRFIATIPNPLVDKILYLLRFLRLVQAETLEEHHGFDSTCLEKYFTGSLRLIKHEKFQFGLNNVFVFGLK